MTNIMKREIYRKTGTAELADRLYARTGHTGSGRVWFFMILDELLLTASQAEHVRDADLDEIIRKYWPDYFPEIPYTEEIGNLLRRYRRAHRDWIWPLFRRFWSIPVEYPAQLEKVLKFRTLVEDGKYDRAVLAEADSDEYYQDEISIYLGDSRALTEHEAEIISGEKQLGKLRSILEKWKKVMDPGRDREPLEARTRMAEWKSPADRRSQAGEILEARTKPAEWKAFPDGTSGRNTDAADRNEEEVSIVSLPTEGFRRNAEASEMEKEALTESGQNSREAGRNRGMVFKSPLMDAVCRQLVLLELAAGERHTDGMGPRELLELTMDGLWNIMPEEINRNREKWISCLKNEFMKAKAIKPLLYRNYGELRDMVVRDSIRIRICTAHVIAEAEDYRLSDETLAERTRHAAVEALDMKDSNDDIARSVRLSVRQFFPRYSKTGEFMQEEVWTFMKERRQIVESWYQWIINRDRTLEESEQAEIKRQWEEYSQRMFLDQSKNKMAVVADLIRGLSDQKYGNILAKMYFISEGRDEGDDPSVVLRNFFRLLNNMGFRLEPVWQEGCRYSGWKLNDEQIVDPR